MPAEMKSLNSWQELAALVEECSDDSWLFRGETASEPESRWPLKPKAGREGSYKGAARKLKYEASDEKAALETYIRQARPHVNHAPANKLEWLAIAQHHGMSTRLLDWSESLLVATFFAVQKANTAWGVVYGVQGLRVVSKREESDPFVGRSPAVYRPPHITPRIPAQRSVFTLHPDPTKEYRSKSLRIWIVPPMPGLKIKKVLDACAINESSLFPDLDGLSRYIGWRYKWGKS